MRRVSFVITALIFVFAMLVTSCAPAAATEGPSFIPEEPTIPPQPTPTHVRVDLTPAQRAALNALAEKLSLPADKITLVSTEEVIWPDGCLGIVRMGVMCTQAQVPGFRIILEANGQKYEYHTNQDGSIGQLAEGAQQAGEVEKMLIKQLAANLGLQESDVTLVSSTAVEFPDSCLGVAMPDVMCAQVVTAGHIVVLDVKGIQYEYHTNADGSEVQPATFALTWKREGGIAGFCDNLVVFRSGEVYTSQCKAGPEGKMGTFASLLTAKEEAQFDDWMTRFGNTTLDDSDPKGVSDRMMLTLELFGSGDKQPTKAEQQALFEFAQNLYQKLSK